MLQSHEIRQRFLDFFAKRGHAVLPSASLVPQNDPTVLFNTAGMQPLVPYLMGQKHPLGKRVASCQKCLRTGDLEDIGDNRHFSFFEMLGNWSFGDYFKEDAIKWSYEFLTSKEEGLGLDPTRLYVTVFEGDQSAPRDTESVEIWKKIGIPESRIYFLGADDNWWSPGDNGPCGPDTEMFYDMTENGLGELSKDVFIEAVRREDAVEVWNDVFMEYEKRDGKVVGKLAQKNVDTGAGLERLNAVVQGKKTAYDTDLFGEIFDIIGDRGKSGRIVADHLRAAVFLIVEGVRPAKNDRGYVLRRLIRRAVLHTPTRHFDRFRLMSIVGEIVKKYSGAYPELKHATGEIFHEISEEAEKFAKTLSHGLKKFDQFTEVKIEGVGHEEYKKLPSDIVFDLITTYGFPIELIREIAEERGLKIEETAVAVLLKQHQVLSRAGAEQKFKGGLANTNEKTIRLHTAHHLLLGALQKVLGGTVHQRGSNITEERLRIDFSFERKMSKEELAVVENLVNEWIAADLDVVQHEMQREEAEKLGAEMEFGAKYPDVVSVYTIKNTQGEYISKEFCGGPHVKKTSELGKFKIAKEEAVSAGVRRIKAVLE